MQWIFGQDWGQVLFIYFNVLFHPLANIQCSRVIPSAQALLESGKQKWPIKPRDHFTAIWEEHRELCSELKSPAHC